MRNSVKLRNENVSWWWYADLGVGVTDMRQHGVCIPMNSLGCVAITKMVLGVFVLVVLKWNFFLCVARLRMV